MKRDNNKWLDWVGWCADATFGTIGLIVEKASDECAEIAIRALPLVAPLPNAIGLFFVAQSALRFDYWQALAFALSAELALFGLVDVVLRIFNNYLADKERYKWPLVTAIVCATLMLLIVAVVVYSLEVVHAGGNKILAVLPFISGVGAVALAIRRWDNVQVETKRMNLQAEHERRLELKAAKAVNKPAVNSVNEPVNTPVDSVNSSEFDTEKLLEFYRDNPVASLRKAGAAMGVSHTMISKTLKALESEGRVHVNGKVEVQP